MRAIVLQDEIANGQHIQYSKDKYLELDCADYLESVCFGYIVGKIWDVNRYFGVFEMLDGKVFKTQTFNISKVKVTKG